MNQISFVFIIAIVPVIAELPDLGYADFDCPDMKPSSAVPINVNRVRPGDIKVIGALGDSLTAGSGAGAISWVPWLNYRGMNFAIGGQLELEHHVTIPNILKKFNPNLFGQSLGIGPVDDWNAAQLNVAIGGQKAEDLLAQAKDLVEKMKMHGVHIGNDWKLITIFIGTNDAKEFCKDKEPLYNPANYSINIRRALRFLQINLPRTIVNLIAMQNEQIWTKTQAHEACKRMPPGPISAEMIFQPDRKSCLNKIASAYQQAAMEIQDSGVFDRSDFTVIVQPFWLNTFEPARLINGTVDSTFWSIDCFHYSYRGNAIIAKMLWNNMMQPVGNKRRDFNLSDPSWPLKCPEQRCPYIRTVRNSRDCGERKISIVVLSFILISADIIGAVKAKNVIVYS